MQINLSIGMKMLRTPANIYLMHNLKLIYPNILASIIHHARLVYDAHEIHIGKRINKTKKQHILTCFDRMNEKLAIRFSHLIIQASVERAIFFKKYYKTKMPLALENHANYSMPIKNNVNLIKSNLNLAANDKIVIFTGFITYNGNQKIENVIQSLHYLEKNIHFCLLGPVSDYAKNKFMLVIQSENLEKRVHFLQPVQAEKVVSCISDADVAVIPIAGTTFNSKFSALNKISQSLMAGLPICCSNYPNLRRIVKNNKYGEIGSLFNENNPQEIAYAIKYCLDHDMATSFRNNATKLAKEVFNWENEEVKLLRNIQLLLSDTINCNDVSL